MLHPRYSEIRRTSAQRRCPEKKTIEGREAERVRRRLANDNKSILINGAINQGPTIPRRARAHG